MHKGFTLIELLVVIGIIILLTAITLPYFRVGGDYYALQRSTHKLAQNIRWAQEMAMSARKTQIVTPPRVPIGGYGVHFNRYTVAGVTNYKIYLFADLNNNGRYDSGERVEQIVLERGVRIKEVRVGENSPDRIRITFRSPDPTVFFHPFDEDEDEDEGGVIIILCLKRDENRTKAISVNKAGLIAID